MSYNFTFNGKHSMNDMDVYTEIITRPLFAEPKTVYEDIPGTDGEICFTASNPKGRMCFKPRIIELECHIGSGEESISEYLQKAAEVAKWLATDNDKILIFDDEPNIFYMAHAANLFNLENITDFSGTFPVVFKCSPFRFDMNEISVDAFEMVDILNDGYYTGCIIEVTGTSENGFSLSSDTEPNKTLSVNTEMTDSAVVVDTENMTVKMNGISILHDCEGDFFELHPGHNIISITPDDGSVRFSITYRPRYL